MQEHANFSVRIGSPTSGRRKLEFPLTGAKETAICGAMKNPPLDQCDVPDMAVAEPVLAVSAVSRTQPTLKRQSGSSRRKHLTCLQTSGGAR